MEEGDHSGCMIELLACPEHMNEQLRAMQENIGYSSEEVWVCPPDSACLGCGLPLNTHDYTECLNIPGSKSYRKCDVADPIVRATGEEDEPLSPAPHCECGCADADQEDVVCWCLWCDHVYVEYTRTTEDQHFAYHCPEAPQELKDSARARLAARSPEERDGQV
jgi:hypothetical protein